MVVIPVAFHPFSETHIGDLFGRNGVYVIWDARAKARPTYIGEGNVLVRFGQHSSRKGRKFARPLDGYIALLNDISRRTSKVDACVVERLLLDVAQATDRAPRVNAHPGHGSAVESICSVGRLRINIKGYDPFRAPARARRIDGTKSIEAWATEDGYEFRHDWRLRRLNLPII